MTRHESEIHRERREIISYIRELIDRKVIHWRDVPANVRAIVVTKGSACDLGLFSDQTRQTDLIDMLRK